MESVTLPELSIKTDHFEGPLELLIELVEKRKLLINNINLAAVTDEYLERVSAMQERSLPNTAQFITLAATLLLIKSKSLLPSLDLSSEEEASIDDLEKRLQLYQLFRNIASSVQENFGSNSMYSPEYQAPREPLFLPDSYCDIDELSASLRDVISELPKPATKQTAKVTSTISLEEMMNKLENRIRKQFKLSFFDIKTQETEQKSVIVGFLAILELFKQGNMIVTQSSRFDDILVELHKSDTPQYY